jgi:hypothetical protein
MCEAAGASQGIAYHLPSIISNRKALRFEGFSNQTPALPIPEILQHILNPVLTIENGL